MTVAHITAEAVVTNHSGSVFPPNVSNGSIFVPLAYPTQMHSLLTQALYSPRQA